MERAVVSLQPFPGAELSQLWVLSLVWHGHRHGYSKLWTHRDKSLHIIHLFYPFFLAGSCLSTDTSQLSVLVLGFAIHCLDTKIFDTTIRSLHAVKQIPFRGLFVCFPPGCCVILIWQEDFINTTIYHHFAISARKGHFCLSAGTDGSSAEDVPCSLRGKIHKNGRIKPVIFYSSVLNTHRQWSRQQSQEKKCDPPTLELCPVFKAPLSILLLCLRCFNTCALKV